MAEPARDITLLLKDVASGDREAMGGLVTALYDDLRRLAESHLRRERPDHTLQATALVHEVYFRLIDQRLVDWRDRVHFFGAASQVIRRILVDSARAKKAERRGGERRPVMLDEVELVLARSDIDLITLDDALHRLTEIREVQGRIVELRLFGGLTIDAIADLLGLGARTVDREWSAARAWLYRELVAPE